MGDRHVRTIVMSTPRKKSAMRRDLSTDRFYLPAASIPTKVSRIEAYLSEKLDFHGVVPMPARWDR